MQNHVRPDGSTYHVVNYDPTNGRVLGRHTAQGYADSSTWARGQAWAVYGFTMVYRYTRDPRFLQTAEKVAAYFVDHLPVDRVPYWDFRAPGIPNEPRDASAAAIAASALLELSSSAADPVRSAHWRSSAEAILRSLASDSYLSTVTPSNGILLHSVTSKPANVEVDVSLIYADYYLLEALLRYRRLMEPE
jgi:unsaturated chondroitin disaccharide hydrolase